MYQTYIPFIYNTQQPTVGQGTPAGTGTPQAPPQAPAQAPTQTPPQAQKQAGPQKPSGQQKPALQLPTISIRTIIIAIAIAIVAIEGAFMVMHKPQGTTTASTTMQAIKVGSIKACGAITNPGSYYLSGNIKTAISSGACINITVSNVALVCNQHSILGSGPYSGVPPFTYGIEINSQTNVSVSGCTVSYFSYGVYARASRDLSIHDSNISSNYLSDTYLNNTQDSSILNNIMTRTSSTYGALYITNGSSNNRVYNNSIEDNRFYGIHINSTGNRYVNNTLNYNPASFYCNILSSFPRSSYAHGNYCYNSTGCSFVTCGGINKPANLSDEHLGSRINSCGAITSPGSYQLASSIDISTFTNTLNPAFIKSNMPCIAVNTNNATFDCKGFQISNGTVGILDSGRSNVTIANCSVTKLNYGVQLMDATEAHVKNMTFMNDTFGIYLYNVTSSAASNIRSSSNRYGIYLYGASADSFLGFNSSKNQYGIFLSQSIGNLFSKGTAFNNSAIDVYATPDSVNASYNLMQQATCGLTNTKWASCNQHVSSSLTYYPISGCSTLSRPGNYSLTANIINPAPMCITVNANNVTLNCAGHSISQANSAPGPVIYVNGRSNIIIGNCNIQGATSGINISNSSYVGVYGNLVNSSNYGVSMSNVSRSAIEDNIVAIASNASIKLSHVSMSSIISNNVSYGVGKNVGILINNSQTNRITNNTGATNYIGIEFAGSSHNNTVMNNTMRLSGYTDYLCNGNSGINDELGGINYGNKKMGCQWLAALMAGVTQVSCQAVLQPNTYTLQRDGRYDFGETCFNVYANGTTINCNGHTIIATKGGTFADFKDSNGGNIQNCTLKGFTRPIVADGSSLTVRNNRIADSNATYAAIAMTNAYSSYIQSNNITTQYKGISIASSRDSSLLNNIVALASTAYQIANSIGITINNNTAGSSTGTGMLLSNTTASTFKDNVLLTGKGLVCTYSSQSTLSSDIDNGNNACSGNSGCAWISSSSTTCH